MKLVKAEWKTNIKQGILVYVLLFTEKKHVILNVRVDERVHN